MLNWGLPLGFLRSVATTLLLGALTMTSARAGDGLGSVSGLVSVSASIVGSTGVVRPIASPLTFSTRSMLTGMAVELPRADWLRSTGPADLTSALVLASAADPGGAVQRARPEAQTATGSPASSTAAPDSARAGLIVGSVTSVVSDRRSGSAVMVSRADWRTPGYVSLAMTYE